MDVSINERTLVGFRFGLCGIGWGIEYLIRARYLSVDEDICGRFEHRIHHFLLYDLYQGLGLANGLCGVLLYLLVRIESSLVQPDSDIMFTNKRFIIYALDKFAFLLKSETISDLIKEQDNDTFGEEIPLVLSNWEYPALLWTLGRIGVHGILKEKTESLLKLLLIPLCNKEMLPAKMNNRKLLKEVLASLLMFDAVDIRCHVLELLEYLSDREVEEQVLNNGIGGVSEKFLCFASRQDISDQEGGRFAPPYSSPWDNF